jgi:hypothetical protein
MPNTDVETPSRASGGGRQWPGGPIAAPAAGVQDPLRRPSKTEPRAEGAPSTCNN